MTQIEDKNKKPRKKVKILPVFSVEILNDENQKYISTFCSNLNTNSAEYDVGRYLIQDALKEQKEGNGVTYLIVDEKHNKVISFFTLSSASMLILLKHMEEDDDEYYYNYVNNYLPISSVKVKYFAVDVEYQDLFYNEEPLSAHIFKMMIHRIIKMSTNNIGFKAIFLFSLDSSKNFYARNGGFANISDFTISEGFSPDDTNMLMYRFIYPVDTEYFGLK